MKRSFDVRSVRLVATIGVAAVLLLSIAASAAAATASKAPAAEARATGGITLGLPGIPPVFLGVRPYVARDAGFY